jgi:hypothetical protein
VSASSIENNRILTQREYMVGSESRHVYVHGRPLEVKAMAGCDEEEET